MGQQGWQEQSMPRRTLEQTCERLDCQAGECLSGPEPEWHKGLIIDPAATNTCEWCEEMARRAALHDR